MNVFGAVEGRWDNIRALIFLMLMTSVSIQFSEYSDAMVCV